MKLHVLTACTRPQNLPRLASDLALAVRAGVDVHWHVGVDTARQHVGGQAVKNRLLDEIADGWVYVLDDDNIAPPSLWLALRAEIAARPHAPAFVFSQLRSDISILHACRENVRVGHIDIGQAVIRRDVIGDHRIPETYEGDGEFLAAVLPENTVFIDEVVTYHNGLGWTHGIH